MSKLLNKVRITFFLLHNFTFVIHFTVWPFFLIIQRYEILLFYFFSAIRFQTLKQHHKSTIWLTHSRKDSKSRRKAWSSGKTMVTSFTEAVEFIWSRLMTKPENTSACFTHGVPALFPAGRDETCGARSSSLISGPDKLKGSTDPSQRKSESCQYIRTASICRLPLMRSGGSREVCTCALCRIKLRSVLTELWNILVIPAELFTSDHVTQASQSLGETLLHQVCVCEAYILFI